MFNADAATEAITHFIGLFQLADLKARLRLDYDELVGKSAVVTLGSVAGHDVHVPNVWQFREFTPLVRYTPPDTPPGAVDNGATYQYLPVPLHPMSLGAPAPPTSSDHGPIAAMSSLPGSVHWDLPPPPSVAVVVVQHNVLDDNDMLDAGRMQGVVGQDMLSAQLDGLVHLAAAAGLSPDLCLPASEDGFVTMAARLAQGVAPAEGFTLTGDGALGSYLNGVAADARPAIDDLMPAHWKDLQSREDGDGPTHQVVHGANLLVNEVTLTASWISAPVMMVGGDSYSLDSISQVNVWQDADRVTQMVGDPWNGSGPGTTGCNFAAITHAAHPVPEAVRGDGEAPAYWAVTTIEGSLVNFNWIEQRNFVSDNDVTSVTLTGSSTTMIFGANQSMNAVSLLELGSQFDLIIVDGNLVNIASIIQANVLLDSDHVTLPDGGRLSSGDNLLLNDASILQVGREGHLPAAGDWLKLLTDGPDATSGLLDDPSLAGLGPLRVLHIKGDLVSAQIIEQINVLGDADQVDLLAARAMENAGDVSVVTGSNVLVNAAHVAEFGIDTIIHTRGGVYSDALIHQAELVDTISPYAGAGLASEAVVFLADGMTDIAAGPDDADFHAPVSHSIPADPMQTVLA